MAKTKVTIGTDVVGSSVLKEEQKHFRIAGLLLIGSPVLWFIGAVAFMPQLGGFYATGDSLTKLNALIDQQAAWTIQSLIFFAGTLATVFGLGLLANILRQTRATRIAQIGVAGIVAVAAVCAFILFLRLSTPTSGAVTADTASLMMAAHFGWLASVFTGFTILTIAVYGAALFWTKQAKISGAVVVSLSILVLILLLIGGPLPPVIVYPIAAILGVRMLFKKVSLN